METETDFIFMGSKITADGTLGMKLKGAWSLEESMTNLAACYKAQIALCQQMSI